MIQNNWQELIKPTKLDIVPGNDSNRHVRIVAEPLERGFGLTLGNALRRILLSSIQGAAVVSVQIDGVLHEFSSIAGVREDITDIVLNIKQMSVKCHSEGVKRMILSKKGPGVVTAGDIEEIADVEILNPDLVLCTLDDGADVRFEFTVNTGNGYVRLLLLHLLCRCSTLFSHGEAIDKRDRLGVLHRLLLVPPQLPLSLAALGIPQANF